MIPKPGSRVWITYGKPFEVSPGKAGFAEGLERAAAGLKEVSRKDAWHDAGIAIG
jgi:hypothetical protein